VVLSAIRAQRLNMIHTLNVVQLSVVSDDRRERAWAKRRQRFLDAASRIIDRDGLVGVTMQAVADELDCAVGTIYTYFPSKAALLTALQHEAVATLRSSYRTARHQWDAYLDTEEVDDQLRPLVQLMAYAGFCIAASVVYADEFHLQRLLLAEPVSGDDGEAVGDALAVLRALLEEPRDLLTGAAEAGVLDAGDPTERALRWLAALNGVLLLEHLGPLDRHLFRAPHLTRSLTADLLVGWGAVRTDVEVAASHVERLSALGPLAPPLT
jgi:AcrR family transcriptional regulator